MIAEHLNEYGTKFKCYDDTNLVIDSERYIYHMVNVGGRKNETLDQSDPVSNRIFT